MTIYNIWGAETGGLEEVASADPGVSASATAARTGGYGYLIDNASGTDLEVHGAGNWTVDTGEVFIIGFWIQFETGVTPSGAWTFFECVDKNTNRLIALRMQTDGDVTLNDNGGTVATVTTPVSADTWHFFEIFWESRCRFHWSTGRSWDGGSGLNSVLNADWWCRE